MEHDDKPAPDEAEVEQDIEQRAAKLEKELREAEQKHPPRIDKAEDGGVI